MQQIKKFRGTSQNPKEIHYRGYHAILSHRNTQTHIPYIQFLNRFQNYILIVPRYFKFTSKVLILVFSMPDTYPAHLILFYIIIPNTSYCVNIVQPLLYTYIYRVFQTELYKFNFNCNWIFKALFETYFIYIYIYIYISLMVLLLVSHLGRQIFFSYLFADTPSLWEMFWCSHKITKVFITSQISKK
jgi:hypothetical protein